MIAANNGMQVQYFSNKNIYKEIFYNNIIRIQRCPYPDISRRLQAALAAFLDEKGQPEAARWFRTNWASAKKCLWTNGDNGIGNGANNNSLESSHHWYRFGITGGFSVSMILCAACTVFAHFFR